MTLVYINPHSSGLKTTPCKSEKDIEKVLAKKDVTEQTCSGENVYYVFIDKTGKETKGSLDFT